MSSFFAIIVNTIKNICLNFQIVDIQITQLSYISTFGNINSKYENNIKTKTLDFP